VDRGGFDSEGGTTLVADGTPTPDRREFLAGLACAGCVVPSGCLGNEQPVTLFAAGSLNDAVERGLRPALDTPLQVTARGSAELARLVAEGSRTPDLLSLADPVLFDRIDTAWYTQFATNELVVAYDPDGAGGRRVADAGREAWYEALLADDVRLGRTDPDLDPLGYRTLFAFDLATDHYDTGRDLRRAIPAREQIYPETQLLGQFETGGIDAAVTYRSMAVGRGYDYVSLPAAVNLGEPALADRYAETSYELPDGTVVAGDAISYAATVLRSSPTTRDVFTRHVGGAYLTEYGFTVPDDYPRHRGDVPDTID